MLCFATRRGQRYLTFLGGLGQKREGERESTNSSFHINFYMPFICIFVHRESIYNLDIFSNPMCGRGD